MPRQQADSNQATLAKSARRWKITLTVVFLFVLQFVFVNCGRPSKVAESDDFFSSLGANLDYKVINDRILKPKCAACHVNYTTYSSLLGSGYIITNSPEQSSFYLRVANGSMPQGGPPLSPNEVKAIYQWIADGALESADTNQPSSSPTPTPSPTPAPTPTPTPSGNLQPKFSVILSDIIGPRCTSCHNATTASGGVRLTDYATVRRRVTPFNANGSVLYLQVYTDAMPDEPTKLTFDEKETIRQWINSGAQDN